MYNINRTRCGIFDLKDAFTLSEIESGKFKIVSLEDLFDYPCISLSQREIDQIKQGVKLPTEFLDGNYKIYQNNDLFGIGYVHDGQIRMRIKV